MITDIRYHIGEVLPIRYREYHVTRTRFNQYMEEWFEGYKMASPVNLQTDIRQNNNSFDFKRLP